jgi:hypothetical protein
VDGAAQRNASYKHFVEHLRCVDVVGCRENLVARRCDAGRGSRAEALRRAPAMERRGGVAAAISRRQGGRAEVSLVSLEG